MPKRWLVTGLTGTLAPFLAREAVAGGDEVIAWDRHAVDLGDPSHVRAHVRSLRPDAIAHLALGPESWAIALAQEAADAGCPLLFTSTAMVFDHAPDGPHRPDDAPNARDDYGRYKIRCEAGVMAANPQAMIARLGWQIDPLAGGNNMVAALDAQQQRDGSVGASRRWRPACAFMVDTAQALAGLLRHPHPGLHHLDANAEGGHSFHDIVLALAASLHRGWNVRADDAYVHDQRLLGGPTRLPGLHLRLPALPGPR